MRLTALIVLATLLPVVAATHEPGCVPTQQDPATYTLVVVPEPLPLAGTYYLAEDGGVAPLPGEPVPASGMVLGEGSFWYQETAALAGLQRGGIGLPTHCDPIPEICIQEPDDPIVDEHCGHGPDAIVFAGML